MLVCNANRQLVVCQKVFINITGDLKPLFTSLALCFSAVPSNRSCVVIEQQEHFCLQVLLVRGSNSSVFDDNKEDSVWQVFGAALNAVENRLAVVRLKRRDHTGAVCAAVKGESFTLNNDL